MKRREVLVNGVKFILFATCGGLIFKNYQSSSLIKLRPPGAISEDKFISTCIRCGLCVNACPFDTLKLANFGDKNIENGTPFFKPREIPCEMCVDIPCAVACPTKALDLNLLKNGDKFDINLARMGVAIIDDKSCVAYFGVQCDACYRACPLIDKAITIEYQRNERTGKHAKLIPIVNSDFCTGCGKCQKACITKKAAISVVLRDMVIGEINDNYVKGWVENDDKKLENSDTKIELNFKKGFDYLNEGEL